MIVLTVVAEVTGDCFTFSEPRLRGVGVAAVEPRFAELGERPGEVVRQSARAAEHHGPVDVD